MQNEKVAFAVAPGVTIILILFGGFYVNSSTIPAWLRWCAAMSHDSGTPHSFFIIISTALGVLPHALDPVLCVDNLTVRRSQSPKP